MTFVDFQSPLLDKLSMREIKAVKKLAHDLASACITLTMDDNHRLMCSKESASRLTQRFKDRVSQRKDILSCIILHNAATEILGGVVRPDVCPYCNERIEQVPFEVHPQPDNTQGAMF